MNEILKQATNPSYNSLEEALPEYDVVLNYYKNLVGINKNFTEQEIINMGMEEKVNKNLYREKELFSLIIKMGLNAYQVINHSFDNAKSNAKYIKDIDIERAFIESIVMRSEHVLEIANYYFANDDTIFYLKSTIEDGTKLANTLNKIVEPHLEQR